jgi:hypothetical protein
MKIDKTHILAACLQKQEKLIHDFSSRLTAMVSEVNTHDHSASQTENRAATEIELINAIQNELDFALEEMEFLKNLDPKKKCETVVPGAVVVTNTTTFYICVSIERILVAGHEIVGMSVKAPLYAAMRGLKKGAAFQYNTTKYTILDIY